MKLKKASAFLLAMLLLGFASAGEQWNGHIEKVYTDKVGPLAGSIIFRASPLPKSVGVSLVNIRWSCQDSKPSVGTRWNLQVRTDGDGRYVAFKCDLDTSK